MDIEERKRKAKAVYKLATDNANTYAAMAIGMGGAIKLAGKLGFSKEEFVKFAGAAWEILAVGKQASDEYTTTPWIPGD